MLAGMMSAVEEVVRLPAAHAVGVLVFVVVDVMAQSDEYTDYILVHVIGEMAATVELVVVDVVSLLLVSSQMRGGFGSSGSGTNRV